MNNETDNTAWSRQRFNMMRDGGTWAVPRSGLIFTRRGNELHLTAKMPFMQEMADAARDGRDVPATREELESHQQQDFDCIAREFRRAGIETIDKTS